MFSKPFNSLNWEQFAKQLSANLVTCVGIENDSNNWISLPLTFFNDCGNSIEWRQLSLTKNNLLPCNS